MLFHVTMTHAADDCPAYHTERMSEVVDSLANLDKIGKELHVKAHALLWGAPDHIAFAVLEADDLGAIGRYLTSIAITQDFQVTPVQHVSEVIELSKALAARTKK